MNTQKKNNQYQKKYNFQQKQAEKLQNIPVYFHQFFINMAWDMSYREGYSAVLNTIDKLIVDFLPTLEKYHDNRV